VRSALPGSTSKAFRSMDCSPGSAPRIVLSAGDCRQGIEGTMQKLNMLLFI